MFKNQPALTQVAIVIGAFLVGTALGHWISNDSDPVPAAVPSAVVPHVAPSQTVKSAMTAAAAENADQTTKESAGNALSHAKSLDEILKGRNSGNRTKELEEFAKNISASEIGAALKQLRKMPDSSARELALRLLASRWVETDPNGALQFAIENRDFDYLASDVMQQMAASDLQGALATAQSITDPNARYQALRGVLSFMADTDPMGALQLASTLGSFPNNEPLSQMIYRQWSSVDPQAAALRAAQDPQGEGWRSPVGQVLRNWASQDPLAAIAWSNSQSDSSVQARDIGQIIRQWSRDDMNAAANWVNSLQAGSVRDAAAAALAFSMGGNDPSAALGWAQSITDATQRDNALQRLSREIMYRNPTNGAAILAAAGVPANLISPPPAPNQQPGGRRGR
jgi:hypothetical protein